MSRLRPPALLILLLGCGGDVDYLQLAGDRPDIRDVAECAFEPTQDDWEEYTCVPIFSANDPEAGEWEAGGIGEFDLVQREIFGAPFYQLWYSGRSGLGSDVGYALSMDGTTWRRHPWNPVVRKSTVASAWDRDDLTVGCVAFDGDAGVYHLWYQGTNVAPGAAGTLFGHATSTDGVLWDKDILNPLDPLEQAGLPFNRVWGCDALYEDGRFHFWVSGAHYDIEGSQPHFETARYDIGYVSTRDGSFFDAGEGLVLEHGGLGTDLFDAEGVHRPSVFTYGDGSDGPRYWMFYSGYQDTIAEFDVTTGFVTFSVDGQQLGVARSAIPDADWVRVSPDPVPLDFSGLQTADSPRAFFINGRLHVFFQDEFVDPFGGDLISGIGLGIAPFPIGQETP